MRKWQTILFYGALWGILEATLGYLLHFTTLPVAGAIMFPIGFAIMRQARLKTESKIAPIQIAAVASCIKLVNLLFVPIWINAFNPAMAILIEGAFATLLLRDESKVNMISSILAASGWRLTYVSMLLIQLYAGYKIRLFSNGYLGLIPYFTLDAITNGLLVLMIVKWVPKFKFEPNTVLAMGSLVISIGLTVGL